MLRDSVEIDRYGFTARDPARVTLSVGPWIETDPPCVRVGDKVLVGAIVVDGSDFPLMTDQAFVFDTQGTSVLGRPYGSAGLRVYDAIAEGTETIGASLLGLRGELTVKVISTSAPFPSDCKWAPR